MTYSESDSMDHATIVRWLRETDPRRLERLWTRADAVRREQFGDAVFLRGLVEVSNTCSRNCLYCGVRASNRQIVRYRMTPDEVFDCAQKAVQFGYGTLVLQAGEDPQLDVEQMTTLIRRIRSETPLAITLSLGERTAEELAAWRAAGANRYLLRFETSNQDLYAAIHPRSGKKNPDGTPVEANRLRILRTLREVGFEVGSGVMIGIPGQRYDDLANDIELFRTLDLDMIGVGPFLASPDTPLAGSRELLRNLSPCFDIPPEEQVPSSAEMTYKVVALARLLCPASNIPATTALATINSVEGRILGLARGANIIMPNLTPLQYRELYTIYPGKSGLHETAEAVNAVIQKQIVASGRTLGVGAGTSRNFLKRCDS